MNWRGFGRWYVTGGWQGHLVITGTLIALDGRWYVELFLGVALGFTFFAAELRAFKRGFDAGAKWGANDFYGWLRGRVVMTDIIGKAEKEEPMKPS